MNPAKRRKTRYICPSCRQSLVYTAYQRHLDLPNIYCPVYLDSSTSSESDSTFNCSDHDAVNVGNLPCEDRDSENDNTNSSSGAVSCESGPEIWDSLDSSDSD